MSEEPAVPPEKDAGPSLIFFRTVPAELVADAPLASSLQNFETCLLLIALKRYPHALVACVSASESAIRAALQLSPTDFLELGPLMAQAQKKFSGLSRYKQADLKRLRYRRNRIVHYGFSPRDDNECADLLLLIALPYLEGCYREFFGLDLKDSLVEELAEYLDMANDVYKRTRDMAAVPPQHCFAAVGHWVQTCIKASYAEDWEEDALIGADEDGIRYQLVTKMVDREVQAALRWPFDCPMCGQIQTFVCDINDALLETEGVRLGRGHCLNCGLLVPADIPFLTEALCVDQMDRQSPAILDDLGIEVVGLPKQPRPPSD